MRLSRPALAVAISLLAWPGPGAAQQQRPDQQPSAQPPPPSAALGPGRRLQATRAELEELLQRLQQAAPPDTPSAQAPDSIRAQIAYVRARLQEGDFQAGDRIFLLVEGLQQPSPEQRTAAATRTVEQQLSDTFPVGPGRELSLPTIGPVSLRGVLRSELEAHLTRAIGRFIKDPVVHARATVRLSIVGGVAKPGFYFVPADAVVSEALMVAGGPIQDAKLSDLRIERSGKPLLEGLPLQQAMAEGRTIDELNLRAGDQFVVPINPRGTTYETVRTVGVLLGIPITIYTLTRIFGKK